MGRGVLWPHMGKRRKAGSAHSAQALTYALTHVCVRHTQAHLGTGIRAHAENPAHADVYVGATLCCTLLRPVRRLFYQENSVPRSLPCCRRVDRARGEGGWGQRGLPFGETALAPGGLQGFPSSQFCSLPMVLLGLGCPGGCPPHWSSPGWSPWIRCQTDPGRAQGPPLALSKGHSI